MIKNQKHLRFYLLFSVISLIGFGIVLHFLDLPGQSVWADEGTSLLYVEHDHFSEVFNTLLTTNSSWSFQPAYYFILYPWMLLFDSSLTALRALSAIFGGLSIVVLMFASWRTWGFQWMCLTGLFAAWSAYGLWYSQEIRPYSLSFLAVSLVLTSYLCAKSAVGKSEARTWQIGLAVFSMFSVWVSILNIPFLVVLACFDLVFHRSFIAWIKLWAPAAIASATFALWLVAHFVLLSEPQKYLSAGPPVSAFFQVAYVALAISVGRTFGPPLIDLRGANYLDVIVQYWPNFLLLAIILSTIAACFLAILLEKNDRREPSLRLLFVLAATFAGVLLLFFVGDAADVIKSRPRHAFSLWPLLALILPCVTYRQPHISATKRRIVGGAAVLGLVSLNVYSVYNYFVNPEHGRDDYRYVGQYISENRDTLPMLALGSKRAFGFYTERTVIDVQGYLPHKSVRTMEVPEEAPMIRELASGWDKVVFIINRPFDYLRPDIQTYLGQVLGPEFAPVEVISPHYFKLYLFERVDKAGDKRGPS